MAREVYQSDKWPRFVHPPAWQAFVASIDARTGRPIETYGFWAVCSRWMTGEEQDRAERLLQAFITIAEADPEHLDIPMHLWASQRAQDVREGRYWRCRREGCLASLQKIRVARHKAELLIARAMREAAA